MSRAEDSERRACDAKAASPALTAAWKEAIRKAKAAGDACKTAKGTAWRATIAKKEAWAALTRARDDEARKETEAHRAAAKSLEEQRTTLISAPRQVIEGLMADPLARLPERDHGASRVQKAARPRWA